MSHLFFFFSLPNSLPSCYTGVWMRESGYHANKSCYRMGSPIELFTAKGAFYDMVQHSGEVQDLEAIFASSE